MNNYVLQTLVHTVYLLGKNLKEAVLDHSTEEEQDDIGNNYFNTGLDHLETKNYTQAVKYFRLAADRGMASAQYNLGRRYALGQGVAQDIEEAAKWIQLAADQGHPKAHALLASLYGSGFGVTKDRTKALEFIKLAVKTGCVSQAFFEYGSIVAAGGDGIKPDYVLAYAWFSVAASQNYRGAESKRASVAGKLTSADRTFVEDLLFSSRTSGGAADETAEAPGPTSEMDQFCSNCGDRFGAEDRYCKGCGKQRGLFYER